MYRLLTKYRELYTVYYSVHCTSGGEEPVKSGFANSGWKNISGPRNRSYPTSTLKPLLVMWFTPSYWGEG